MVNLLDYPLASAVPRLRLIRCPRFSHSRARHDVPGATVAPFAPYPGLFLTFSKPKRRGLPRTLYLRVRGVEWSVTDRRFECVVDEILGSSVFGETLEVRGCARYEEQFEELERMLRGCGFDVITDASGHFALHKREDGEPYRNPESAKS